MPKEESRSGDSKAEREEAKALARRAAVAGLADAGFEVSAGNVRCVRLDRGIYRVVIVARDRHA